MACVLRVCNICNCNRQWKTWTKSHEELCVVLCVPYAICHTHFPRCQSTIFGCVRMDTFARIRIRAYTIHMRCVSHNVFHFTQTDVRIIYGTANKYLRAVEPNNAHAFACREIQETKINSPISKKCCAMKRTIVSSFFLGYWQGNCRGKCSHTRNNNKRKVRSKAFKPFRQLGQIFQYTGALYFCTSQIAHTGESKSLAWRLSISSRNNSYNNSK